MINETKHLQQKISNIYGSLTTSLGVTIYKMLETLLVLQ
jgi:hypothetical protein